MRLWLAAVALSAGCAHVSSRGVEPRRIDARIAIDVVPDEEVAARLGGATARAILKTHVVLRARVEGDEVGPIVLEPAESSYGQPVEEDERTLVAFTGESYPSSRSWSSYSFGESPLASSPPLAGVCAKGTVGCLGTMAFRGLVMMVWLPLAPLTLHRDEHVEQPSDEQVRAAVPRAWALRRALEENERDRLFIVEGKTAERTVRAVSLNHPSIQSSRTLQPFEGRRDVRVGLALPPRPPRLSSIVGGAGPPWAERFGRGDLAGATPADHEAAFALVSCRIGDIQIPGEDSDRPFVKLHLGDRVVTRGTDFWLSPLDLADGAKLTLSLWDADLLTAPDYLATIELTHVGTEVTPRVSTRRRGHVGVTCNGWNRDALERELSSSWIEAHDALEMLEHAPVVVNLGDLSGDLELDQRRADVARVHNELSMVAAYAGWDDERVVALVKRLEVDEAIFLEARRRSIFDFVKRQKNALGAEVYPLPVPKRFEGCELARLRSSQTPDIDRAVVRLLLRDGTLMSARLAARGNGVAVLARDMPSQPLDAILLSSTEQPLVVVPTP